MEERTKQRLVGVFVFIGALFILLPLLFHHSHPRARDLQQTAANNSVQPNPQQQTVVAMNDEQNDAADVAGAPQSTQDNSSADTQTDTAPATAADQMNADSSMQNSTASDTANNPPAGPNPTKIPSIMPSAASSAGAATNANTNSANDANASSSDTTNTSSTQQPTTTPTNSSANQQRLKTAAVKMPTASRTIAKTAMAKEEAWTIQVGAFSEKANVAVLTEKLRNRHFHVYTKQVPHVGGALTAVYIGPERQLSHARLAQENLLADFKLHGQIKRCTV